MSIQEMLEKKFNKAELKWRVQACGIGNDGKPWVRIVPYVSSKHIQSRLDEVFGFDGWQTEYRETSENKVICKLSVWSEKRSQWICKEDGATQEKNTGFSGDSFKSAMSGALKRVASNGLGIGRYLHTYSAEYAECALTKATGYEVTETKDKKNKIYWKPKNLQNDKTVLPKVEETTETEKLTFHKIDGTSTNRQVYENGDYRDLTEDEKPLKEMHIRTLKAEADKRYKERASDVLKLLTSRCKVNSLEQLPLKVFKDLCIIKFDIESYKKIERVS